MRHHACTNATIRRAIDEAELYYYEIANTIQIDPATLSRWLQKELTGKRLKSVQAAIEKLKGEKGLDGDYDAE